jgi:hypothetical protein
LIAEVLLAVVIRPEFAVLGNTDTGDQQSDCERVVVHAFQGTPHVLFVTLTTVGAVCRDPICKLLAILSGQRLTLLGSPKSGGVGPAVIAIDQAADASIKL